MIYPKNIVKVNNGIIDKPSVMSSVKVNIVEKRSEMAVNGVWMVIANIIKADIKHINWLLSKLNPNRFADIIETISPLIAPIAIIGITRPPVISPLPEIAVSKKRKARIRITI